MPLFNAIGNPRWNSPLIRLFGMKIGSGAAPSLAPEIAPSIDVNQMDDPQTFFLRNDRLCGGLAITPALAGNYAYVGVQNPSTSGVIITITQARIRTSTAGEVFGNVGISVPGTVIGNGTRYYHDTRWQQLTGGSTPSAYAFTQQAVGSLTAAGSSIYAQLAVGEWIDVVEPQGIVLHPGGRLMLNHGTVATGTLQGSFMWRERAIPAEELQTG